MYPDCQFQAPKSKCIMKAWSSTARSGNIAVLKLHAYATFDPVDPCLFSLNQHLFVIILMRIESWSVGKDEADWRWVRVSSLYHFLAGYLVSKLMIYIYTVKFIITMNIYISSSRSLHRWKSSIVLRLFLILH